MTLRQRILWQLPIPLRRWLLTRTWKSTVADAQRWYTICQDREEVELRASTMTNQELQDMILFLTKAKTP